MKAWIQTPVSSKSHQSDQQIPHQGIADSLQLITAQEFARIVTREIQSAKFHNI
jgi:hypothetical protein